MSKSEKFMLHTGQFVFLAGVTAVVYGHLNKDTGSGNLSFDYGWLAIATGVLFVASAIWLSCLPTD